MAGEPRDREPGPPGSLSAEWRAAEGQTGLLDALRRGSWWKIHCNPGRAAYRVEADGSRYFVKHYAPLSGFRRVRDFWWGRKPQRAFALSRRLLRRGVRTSAPVALFWRGGVLPVEALLVNEWIEDLRGLGPFAEGGLTTLGADPRREVLDSLAVLVGRLHRLGFYHGALARSLFIAPGPGGLEPIVEDLEQLHRGLGPRRRVKNLERLGRELPDPRALSANERRRFLRVYGREAGVPDRRLLPLWRGIRKRFRQVSRPPRIPAPR